MTISVLVTGGAGYIGSHTCKALERAGYLPISYDNLSRGHRWAVKWGPLEVGDITDTAKLREVIKRHKPQAVMHFAAFAYAGESVLDPARYYQNNVAGSLSLLDAMRAEGVKHIIFSSSCAVHGNTPIQPIPESAGFNPVSPYGFSKLAIERILADYSAAYGFAVTNLRYFNAAGADSEGEIGEAHDPETHLIPLALKVAQEARGHVEIYGDDYETADGTCIRDYVHVSDLAAGHILALEKQLRDGTNAAFNLGTGQGHSVRQVIETARAVTCRDIPAVVKLRRAGDPPVAVADPSHARTLLSWMPRFPELEQIIESAWAWMRKRQS